VSSSFVSPLSLPQTAAHQSYQREVGGATLHHFLQQMMDPEMWYLQALLLSQCQHIALQHHLAHMQNQLIDRRFEA
jgi:hypothetical protein